MNNTKTLRLFQFNVGAGDHAMMEFPSGNLGIIDFHYTKEHKGLPIIPYLRKKLKNNIPTIEFIIVSHYDLDHVKGLSAFLQFCKDKNIKINNIWLAGTEEKNIFKRQLTGALNKYLKNEKDNAEDEEVKRLRDNVKSFKDNFKQARLLIRSMNINKVYANDFKPLHGDLEGLGEVYAAGPLAKHLEEYFTKDFKPLAEIILWKSLESIKDAPIKDSGVDRNLISSNIYFYLRATKLRLSFGGDTHSKVWLDVINQWKHRKLQKKHPLSADIIKVSHHGSSNSSDSSVWDILTGEKKKVFFGISAGKRKNKDKITAHPSSKTLCDIKNICKKKKVEGIILSTNICMDCVVQHLNFTKVHLDDLDNWSSKESDDYLRKNPALRASFQRHRSKGYREEITENQGAKKGLLAYIYDINLESGEIEVKLGLHQNATNI